jgi:hypothetical protein
MMLFLVEATSVRQYLCKALAERNPARNLVTSFPKKWVSVTVHKSPSDRCDRKYCALFLSPEGLNVPIVKLSSKWTLGPGFEASPIGNKPTKMSKIACCHREPADLAKPHLRVLIKASKMGIRIQQPKQLNVHSTSEMSKRKPHVHCKEPWDPSPHHHSMPLSSLGLLVKRFRI